MLDVTDLRATIVPRSDQLNSEQLIHGPLTITVTNVTIGSAEQPITVNYECQNGRPFKPCLTMRKVLIFAWGADGREWIGRQMTLYNDQQVRFGGAEVGGIRISHMTDIERDIEIRLTATRGKKAMHTIKRIERVNSAESERLAQLAATGYDCADIGVAALAQFWKGLSKADQLHFAETKDTKWKPRAEASQAAA
jgi:hypothetical protein